MKGKVVHSGKKSFDVYVGRPSKWGNPYSHKEGTKSKFIVETRKEALELYREYLLNNEELMKDLDELKGKTLGCWCNIPKNGKINCHAQILLEVIEGKSMKLF